MNQEDTNMQTPRQVLLKHHRSATARLDAVRQKFLAEEVSAGRGPSQVNDSVGVLASVRAFFHPLRWHLTAMSAVWLLAALLNVESSPPSTRALAQQQPAPAHQLLAALRANRRQLLELMDMQATAPSPAPAGTTPLRRSELQTPTAMA